MKFRQRKLLLLETNIDDMNPEWFEPLIDSLLAAGALDVILIPLVMKRSRPAVLLQVLTDKKGRERLFEIIFRETTTLGIRSSEVNRVELRREVQPVKTPYGVVQVKVGRNGRGEALNIAPEYSSCLSVAKKRKVPLKKVYQSALTSFSSLTRSHS